MLTKSYLFIMETKSKKVTLTFQALKSETSSLMFSKYKFSGITESFLDTEDVKNKCQRFLYL